MSRSGLLCPAAGAGYVHDGWSSPLPCRIVPATPAATVNPPSHAAQEGPWTLSP